MKRDNKSIYGSASIILLMLLAACGGEKTALKEETLYFQKVHADWITSDSIDDSFIMTDNNGISQSFLMKSNSYYFNKGWGSFLGVNTSMTLTEYHHQAYNSGFGMSYTFSLTAGDPPYGDHVFISLGDVGFHYDFDLETVFGLNTQFGYMSYLITDQGYEVDDDGEILSKVEILDSLDTQYASYKEVLHFNFNDFSDLWTDFTVCEIYVAKGVGLVKYVLANGLTGERRD